MIRSWGNGYGSAGRSRGAALLIGLVLVIAAHLTGAVHACAFADPGPGAVVAYDLRPVAERAEDTGLSALPSPRRPAVNGAGATVPAQPALHHGHAAGRAEGAGSTGPAPRHRHAVDGHSDHSADRPRAGLDDSGLGGEAHPPLHPAGSRGRSPDTSGRGPRGVSLPCVNGSAFVLGCVLRQ
ncbi:hypothetical protein [Streptomyces sp. NRRL B-3648]|uniref:hypothetical protein n=1 Tax=Streptomyces sp. NRRL B-3648 TaxID=1519493 RepID=UPI000AE8B116|nr:hypothetical protein [Streptomyces sp. NRRL B-3648]